MTKNSAVILCGFKARLYPTKNQETRLNQWAGSLRFLWNRLLEAEKTEYAATGKFLWRKQLQTIAVGMKHQPEMKWLADLPTHAVLDTSARMDGALRRMVSERKAGHECGFPKAKKKFINEAGIYCVGERSRLHSREATLPKIGKVKMRSGAIPKGRLIAARVSRDGTRWMLSAQFECSRPTVLESTGVIVAVDLGVSTLITAFDGSAFEEVTAPRYLRKMQKRLRRAQRMLSRRKKGSSRRRVQARRVGMIHRKVRERRKNLLHQISHRLTAKADVLKVETLNVKGMAKNHRLALSVADAGISRLVTFCEYKANWRGREVIKIDPWFPSSQLCCVCGVRHPEMRKLRVRTMTCECGNVIGRDRNAAVNIYYWYPEERENRDRKVSTRMEMGDQELAPVPVKEVRIDVDKGRY